VAAQWKAGRQTNVGTWLCFSVISDLPADEKRVEHCAACDMSQVSVRVQINGQLYTSTTLEGCQPDPKVASQKVSEFLTVLDIIMIPLSGANLLRVVSSRVVCIGVSFTIVLYFLFFYLPSLLFDSAYVVQSRDRRQEMAQQHLERFIIIS